MFKDDKCAGVVKIKRGGIIGHGGKECYVVHYGNA